MFADPVRKEIEEWWLLSTCEARTCSEFAERQTCVRGEETNPLEEAASVDIWASIKEHA